MINEEYYNKAKEDNLLFSADIIEKINNGDLIEGQSCISDWLMGLSYGQLYALMKVGEDNFSPDDGSYDEEELDEDEIHEYDEEDGDDEYETDLKDVILASSLIHDMETNSTTPATVDDAMERTQLVFLCTALEVLRRQGFAEIDEKFYLSDPDKGLASQGVNT